MSKLENKKYSFWELLQKVGIKIPIIQRDYAQGRNNKKVKDIRDSFLDSLVKILNENKNIDLDFVYGTIKDNYLIPLDGQQRLTTLFLLHYFLALQENKLNEDIKKIFLRFTYETRLSSREFIKLLIEKDIKLDDRKISIIIKDQTWFFSSWKNDPTIKSMLTMLDAIQEKFKDKKFFEKLILIEESGIPPIITFSFLDLEEFKLTDELYVKMNARGKPLTEFENFKSKFVEYFKDEETKAKLDNEWLDIFWEIAQNKDNDKEFDLSAAPKMTDEMFYNFFKHMTLFFKYRNIKDISKFDIFKFKYDKYHINIIAKILDSLISYEDIECNIIREDLKIFINFLQSSEKISYADRARFYVLMTFFIKKGLPSENPTQFKSWLRVNINIINNTAYDKFDDFIKSIKFIYKLSHHIDDLYQYLENYNRDNISEQLQEEILKAYLIVKNPDVENLFIEVEKHFYLDGEIAFLIDFAGSKENFIKGYFVKYFDKFNVLWDFIKKSKGNKILLHRALLIFSKEKNGLGYLNATKRKNSNKYTFGSFGTGLREKNENWRRIFKSNQFRQLLNTIQLTDSIEIQLKNIVDDFEFNCTDWRSYIINPNKKWSILDKIRNYQINFKNPNCIYLNQGGTKPTSWAWSKHYELYSYYLYRYLKDDLDKKPFENIGAFASTDEACFYIDGWENNNHNFAIDIKYKKFNKELEYRFSIEFFDRNSKIEEINEKLEKLLKEKKFGFCDEEKRYVNTQFKLCKRNNLINFINKLLKKLTNQT